MSKAQFSLTAISLACAQALVDAKAHDDKALASREVANQQIAILHKNKAVIGRYGNCSGATSFVDGLVAGKLSKKTAQNYLSLFRDAVASGKPVLDWGGSKGGAKRGKAGSKAKGSKAFADMLRPAFNHDNGKSFEALCTDLMAQFEDAKIDTFYEGFVEYFKAQGDEIAE